MLMKLSFMVMEIWLFGFRKGLVICFIEFVTARKSGIIS